MRAIRTTRSPLHAIAALDAAEEKAAPIAADLSRLDALPYLAVHLAKAP